MSKKATHRLVLQKTPQEIQVAKLNLAGVVITGLLSLIGVVLTAYFGYLAVIPPISNSQTVTIITTPIPNNPNTASPSNPKTLNSQDYFGYAISIGCATSVLILLGAGLIFLKKFPHLKLEVASSERKTTAGITRKPNKSAHLINQNRMGGQPDIFAIVTDTRIGRDEKRSNLLLVNNGDASGLHCSISETDKVFLIKDEGSTNGTFLNGVLLDRNQIKQLNDGDVIRIGQQNLIFKIDHL